MVFFMIELWGLFVLCTVIAAEPHSVLPIGIVILTPQSGVLPVNKLRALASNAVRFL